MMDDIDAYIAELEEAILSAAAMFGGNATPALSRWVDEYEPLISQLRRQRRNTVRVGTSNAAERDQQPNSTKEQK